MAKMSNTEFSLKVDDKDVVYEIRKPSLKDRQEADKLYRRLFNSMLNEPDSILRADIPELARKRNLWNDEKQAELAGLEKEIVTIEAICATSIDPETKQKVTLKHAAELAKHCREELRPKLYQLKRNLADLDEFTVESQAEQQRFLFIMAASIFNKETGKKVFPTYEDLLNRQDETLTLVLLAKYNGVYYNSDDNYITKLPENKFLKDWGFVDDKLRYIKDGKLVDFKGRAIDENGYLINELGEKIDEFGNLIDDSGNYKVDGKVSFLDDEGNEVEMPAVESEPVVNEEPVPVSE
jgi:hypothetical protein